MKPIFKQSLTLASLFSAALILTLGVQQQVVAQTTEQRLAEAERKLAYQESLNQRQQKYEMATAKAAIEEQERNDAANLPPLERSCKYGSKSACSKASRIVCRRPKQRNGYKECIDEYIKQNYKPR